MRINNERGVTLAITLLVVIVLITLGAVFILRVVNERNVVEYEQRSAKAFYIAEGGVNAALETLDNLINTDMLNTVSNTNPQYIGNKAKQYVNAGDGLGFLILACRNNNTPQFVLNGTQAEHTVGSTNLGDGDYQYMVIVTEQQNPYVSGVDQWDFPYNYRIETTGASSNITRDIIVSGDFIVRVQRDNFAKFALFTDHHRMSSGTTVWFTDKTNFAGPIHTNEQYSFAFNPSGIFDGGVTQHLSKARFYNNGFPVLMNADSNPGKDVPVFNGGYQRSEDTIVLASSVQKADLYDQARGGDGTTGNGIFVANNGTDLIGGIYVRGDADINLSVNGSDNAVYTVTEGSTTKIITVDKTTNQTSVETVGGSTVAYTGQPDGVLDLGTIIYVDGEVSDLQGTVQRDTEITVSSENDIVIQDNVVYSDYTAATGNPGDVGYVAPTASGSTNLLGIVSWGGDVRIGTSAPDDVDIHGVLMARNGVYTVDGYNNTGVGSRGTATLLGGAITQFYGAFGLFNGSTGTQIAGYGRNFVYDDRTLMGKSPPYFPSMKAFIAFTNDLTDKVVWQEGDL